MSNEVINPYQTFRDATGNPLASGTITFYINTTTTLDTIYSDEALTVSQSNPYTLDAFGRIAGDVKFTGKKTLLIKTAAGGHVRTLDNVVTLSEVTDAVDMTYTAAGTGANATTVQAELRKSFYLSNFDTLQELLTAAANNICYIDVDITIAAGVSSIAPDNTTVVGYPGALITSTATVNDLYEIIGSGNNCNFFNLTFTGSVVDAAGYCAIEVTGKDNVTIQNCHVTGHGESFVVQNSTNVKVLNNTGTGAYRFGINFAKVAYLQVKNNRFLNMVNVDGIKGQSTLYTDSGTIYESTFLDITGNTCTGCGRDGIDLAGYFDHVLISDNICHGNTLQGIEVKLDDYEGTHDGAGNAAVLTDTGSSWTVNEFNGKTLLNKTDGSSTTVTSNTATTITGVLSGGTDDDWDIGDSYQIVNGSAQRIKIQDNLCGGATGAGHGIRCDNLTKFTVENNSCHDNAQSGIMITTTCTKFKVSNNDVYNNTQSGIRVQGDANVGSTTDGTINDNRSIDNGGGTLHGIQIGDYVDDIRVKGNDCYQTSSSTTNAGIQISGTTSVGNIFITDNYCPVDKLDVANAPISMGSFSGDGIWERDNITHSSGVYTFDADDATPEVSGGNRIYVTANSNPTTITSLDLGSYEMAPFTIMINDTNTTFQHGTSTGNMRLLGSGNWTTPGQYSMITFICRNGLFIEISRTVA